LVGRACSTIGERKDIGYWWESWKEGDHREDQSISDWTTLKRILEIKWDGLD
jgi:hypothetical protein